jgi:hypothetical protein
MSMSLNVLGVISRAFRLFGTVAAGATPDADDAAVALVAFNAMKRAWFGTLIGPRLGSIALTGATGQAENGGEYQIPGGAAFTLTAPTNPKPGARFGVVDAGLSWTAYPLTVKPNGQLLGGAAANTAISTAGQNTRWWFRGDTGNWVPETDSPSLTSAIEFPDGVIAYMPYMLGVVMAAEFSAVLTPEIEAGNLEGRAVLARLYGRRGRANPDGPIGLYGSAASALATSEG